LEPCPILTNLQYAIIFPTPIKVILLNYSAQLPAYGKLHADMATMLILFCVFQGTGSGENMAKS